jgi:hypothetical protein
LWGLRDHRLLARVRRLLARCRAIALRSNGMSTQHAAICPDSPAPRRGAPKRRRRGARRGRPGSGPQLRWERRTTARPWRVVRSASGSPSASSGRRHGFTQPAGTSWFAPRARAARSASQASPAGRLLVEEKRGRAVVRAEDERQQDQRNGHDDVRVAVEERRDNPQDPSRPRCAHREHGGTGASRLTLRLQAKPMCGAAQQPWTDG